ncbi:MAG: GNAT family N-acetyltransferase [Rhodanobacteraceae bacterium]
MATTQAGRPSSITVARSTPADQDALSRLFDAYRVFYRQPSDPQGAHDFLLARAEGGQSEIFLARDAESGEVLGFTQLYPSFSSVSMRRVWVLNDLFVAPGARRRGVARALMEAARAFARASGALRLVLETAEDNRSAQALYESLGYRRDAGTRHYSLSLDP